MYDVYWRVFNSVEHVDPFVIMDMVGIRKKDQLWCLDLINGARNEVNALKALKVKNG